MRYRRSVFPGGTYFFTVNLADRRLDTLIRHIGNLREAVRKVKANHPFDIVALVVLPDHLHSVWRLPPDDADYPVRWSLIKSCFSRALASGEPIADSRNAKRERGVWQRRYWEHQIRDDADLERHVDYIHFNPVKHGYSQRPSEWPYSTFHRYVARGVLPDDWCVDAARDLPSYGE
ncbi:MAG: transposase [Gammaproteobacteria bacterium]|nr:transposase [Gammaproteobacteria bacterium]